MTPQNQQSDVDEAITEIEYEIGISGFSLSMTDHIKSLIAEIHRLRSERGIAVDGLKRVEKWFGEFPATGKFWEDGTPCSYAAQYGSNGERDFMRSVARETLQKLGENHE